MGIEPTQSAWEAKILPLNYIRIWSGSGVMSSARAIATCTSQFYFHLQDLPLGTAAETDGEPRHHAATDRRIP